jgi:signal peptidase I
MSEKKKKSKIVDVIFWIVMALVAVALLCVVFLGKQSDRPTFLFGKTMLWVETESMDPTIEAKSYISVRQTDGKNLKVGDVITFVCRDQTQLTYGKLITHRIVEVTADGYKTKGDNKLSNVDPWTVATDDVVAVYDNNLPFMTFVGRVFSSWVGLMIIGLVFILTMGFVYVPDLIAAVKSENEESADQIKQREIERLVAEEVARLAAQNKANNEFVANETTMPTQDETSDIDGVVK